LPSIAVSKEADVLLYFNKDWASYVPSALALGIGFIVPPKQAIAMFMGAFIISIWKTISPDNADSYYFTAASGMVAGEGLMGIFIAVFRLLGIQPLIKA